MKKIALITILFFFITFSVSAQRWKAQNTNLNGYFPMFISVVDSQKAWIMGFPGNFGVSPWRFTYSTTGYLSKSLDGGQTWITNNIGLPSNLGPTNIYARSADTVFAAYSSFTSNNAGYLYKTINGGQSWSSKFSGRFINAIHFFDSKNGVLVTDPDPLKFGIYVSSDAGETWNIISGLKIPAPQTGEYLINYSKATNGNTIILNSTTGRVWRSKDMGQSWEAFRAASTGTNLYYSTMDSKGNCLIAGGSYTDSLNFVGNFYHSPDTGRTWNLQSSTPFIATDVQYVPQTNFALAAVRNNNSPTKGSFKLIISDDNMKTWKVIDTSVRIYALGMINSKTGWATEYQNDDALTQVYRYTGSVLSGLWNGEKLKGELKVAPNPFNTEGIAVQFSGLPKDEYKLLINNISGQLIYSKSLTIIDNHYLQIPTESWPPGMYIATLTSVKGSLSQKMVKM